MIKHIVSSILVALAVGGVTCAPEASAAGPASCQWTSARARKDFGPAAAPTLCAINVCRPIGYWTYHVDDAVVTPGMPAPMATKYHVEASADGWTSLPACPSWTNTSTWSPP